MQQTTPPSQQDPPPPPPSRVRWLSVVLVGIAAVLGGLLGLELTQQSLVRLSLVPAKMVDIGGYASHLKQKAIWRIRSLPAWVPMWTIQMPDGVLDRRLPTVAELHYDAIRVLPIVENLKLRKFFRIFKADLTKECPFWARKDMCTSPGSCQVCECDEHEVPSVWKMQPTQNFVDRTHYAGEEGGSGAASDEDASWGDEYDEEQADGVNGISRSSAGGRGGGFSSCGKLGFCDLDHSMQLTVSDEASRTATYVDLTLNRPGFTAYKGRNIWGLIYKENCMVPDPLNTNRVNSQECTEEESFHRIVSGMQTVIMISSAEYNKINDRTPQQFSEYMEDAKRTRRIITADEYRSLFTHDLDLFKNRVAHTRAWLENLYFTFGVLLQTVQRLRNILLNCDCNTGLPQEDAEARLELAHLLKQPFASWRPEYARNVPLFERKRSLALRQFQNITRIMDCLECEKCRLHGKVKLLALQLALKSSGPCNRVIRVERNELIALINALGYFADGIASLGRFQSRLTHLRLIWITSILTVLIPICLACFGFLGDPSQRRQPFKGGLFSAITSNPTADSSSINVSPPSSPPISKKAKKNTKCSTREGGSTMCCSSSATSQSTLTTSPVEEEVEDLDSTASSTQRRTGANHARLIHT